jgi:hypothetical protein
MQRTTNAGRRSARLASSLLAAALVVTLASPAYAADPREPTPPRGPEPTDRPHPRGGPPIDLEPEPPAPGAIASPVSLNLFVAAGFRYQDTNYYACTATSALDMLNFIALRGTGGTGFRWTISLSNARRDALLGWERTHDTLAGGNGSDPHGWRNALNYYGWGSAALYAGSRVYEDYGYSSYERGVKAAVRSMIRFRKPIGIAAWRGTHAHVITGYDGLKGDPFARDAEGRYTNDFTIAAVYLTDPLKASGVVNSRVTYSTLGSTTNQRVRFAAYWETDSPYDDAYTSGWIRARDEWYGRWVVIAAIR